MEGVFSWEPVSDVGGKISYKENEDGDEVSLVELGRKT